MSAIDDYLRAVRTMYRGEPTEHSYRRALADLLEALRPGVVATNEPKHRRDCGAPDMSVREGKGFASLTIGYLECKDIGVSLDAAESSDQLKRYRESLDNLILTDYLQFRWYVEGTERARATLAHVAGDKIVTESGGEDQVAELLGVFLATTPQPIASARELARRMADLTSMIRDIIIRQFARGDRTSQTHGLLQAFRDTLLPNIGPDEFADMFAQTLAYGLFAARVNHPAGEPFDRYRASREIPRTNPFLRDLFETITGNALDAEPYVGFVDDLARLLAHADMNAVLEDFGTTTRQEDPIVHFYETFLAEYDPKLRETRGVYYTPQPVVSYIVRSVDWILKEHFGLDGGLANEETVTYTATLADGTQEQRTCPKVLILDPACGTGTFLYHVIEHIREQFVQSNNAGTWPHFVRKQLLPRLFGFELLMAPYAVAHLKLGMQLAALDMTEAEREKWAYGFQEDERLGVYLTNTLEEAEQTVQRQFGIMQTIADEANAASEVKRDMPIMVVLGNPPYSRRSQNQGSWVESLMDAWKTTVREEETQLQALSNDFAKFLRFAEHHIEETGAGLVAMITANPFLTGPLFRDMRAHLRHAMDEVYVLDLHGKAREDAPGGGQDQSVFDIKDVGVCISVWVRSERQRAGCAVRHAELWGTRDEKTAFLCAHSVADTPWQSIEAEDPLSPWATYCPEIEAEWARYVDLREVFGTGSPRTDQHARWGTGFVTQQDQLAIAFLPEDFTERISDLLEPSQTEGTLRRKYRLCTTQQWSFDEARKELGACRWGALVTPCLFRPFDLRFTVFSKHVATILRRRVMDHIRDRDNLVLLTTRRASRRPYSNVFVSRMIPEYKSVSHDRNTQVFPLYVYEDVLNGRLLADPTRRSNMNPGFLQRVAARLDATEAPASPEDAFAYIYAVLHSPAYRGRYADMLEIRDYPRVPLTSDLDLFRDLVALGSELVQLHLMEHPDLAKEAARVNYPVPGSGEVETGYPKYFPPGESAPGDPTPLTRGRVYINGTRGSEDGPVAQYFEGIAPEVWEFQVGGYQVLAKWLKDRKGRKLSYDDIRHYQQIVTALERTIGLMQAIDERIGEWPIE